MVLTRICSWARESECSVAEKVALFLGSDPCMRFLEAPAVDRLCWSLPAATMSPEEQARTLKRIASSDSPLCSAVRFFTFYTAFAVLPQHCAPLAVLRILKLNTPRKIVRTVHAVLSSLLLAYEVPYQTRILELLSSEVPDDESIAWKIHTQRRLGGRGYENRYMHVTALGLFFAEQQEKLDKADSAELAEVYRLYRRIVGEWLIEAIRREVKKRSGLTTTVLVSADSIVYDYILPRLREESPSTSLAHDFATRLQGDIQYTELLEMDVYAKLLYAFPSSIRYAVYYRASLSGYVKMPVLVPVHLVS